MASKGRFSTPVVFIVDSEKEARALKRQYSSKSRLCPPVEVLVGTWKKLDPPKPIKPRPKAKNKKKRK